MADWLSKFVEDLFPSKETLRAKSVTLSEAAALLYLDTVDVQGLGAQGKFKLVKIDDEVRVKKPSLKAYYRANQEAINQRKTEDERAEAERAEAEAEAEARMKQELAEQERKKEARQRKWAEKILKLLTRVFVHPRVRDDHPLPSPSVREKKLRRLLRGNPHDAQAHLEVGVCLAVESAGYYGWLLPEMHAPFSGSTTGFDSRCSEEFLKAMSLGLDTALLSGIAHFYYAMVTYTDAFYRDRRAEKTYNDATTNRDATPDWSRLRAERDAALQEAVQSRNRANTALKEAVRQFRRWLRSNPYDLDALSFLAAAYERLGRAADFEKVNLEIAKAEQLQELGVLKETGRSKSRIRQASSTQEKGIAFEELCLDLVRAMGFSATTTSVTADGGIDIVATSTQPLFSGKYIIQCKDWSNTVGEPVVRDLYGVVHAESANKGILITTSKFTKAAQRFAEGKPLELIDGEQFNDLLKQYKIQ